MFNSKILVGDVLMMLGTLEDASVDCVVTSPPYYGLRNYQVEGQIGLEPTLSEFVATMVKVFGEVARVLKPSGTVWLNLGDSYAGSGKGPSKSLNQEHHHLEGVHSAIVPDGLKPKDMCGAPWRVAFGLQDDGWYLRQEIIWHKPNPMPESVRDRCTKSHESIFLLAHPDSGGKYYYDADAVRESNAGDLPYGDKKNFKMNDPRAQGRHGKNSMFGGGTRQEYIDKYYTNGRNKRSVWTIATKPYKHAHFATFPPELPRTCILAGCPPGGTVLDPFAGAGTTLLEANRLQRDAIGIELNPEYAKLMDDRIYEDAPLFTEVDVL